VRVAIFTLTKDRLTYTKKMLKSLGEKTFTPFDHFVIDQGSKDKTVEWVENFESYFGQTFVYPLATNIGINRGVNLAIEHIGKEYDVIVKLDNDVEIETDGWLMNCLNVLEPKLLLSPYVKGLIHNRGGAIRIGYNRERRISYAPFIGGICMIGFRQAWMEDSGGWEYPVPKHAGGDLSFCKKLAIKGYRFGYKEDVNIRHAETTAGQYERYPNYFKERKEDRTKVI